MADVRLKNGTRVRCYPPYYQYGIGVINNPADKTPTDQHWVTFDGGETSWLIGQERFYALEDSVFVRFVRTVLKIKEAFWPT